MLGRDGITQRLTVEWFTELNNLVDLGHFFLRGGGGEVPSRTRLSLPGKLVRVIERDHGPATYTPPSGTEKRVWAAQNALGRSALSVAAPHRCTTRVATFSTGNNGLVCSSARAGVATTSRLPRGTPLQFTIWRKEPNSSLITGEDFFQEIYDHRHRINTTTIPLMIIQQTCISPDHGHPLFSHIESP